MGTEIPGVTAGSVRFQADRYFWFSYDDGDTAWAAGLRIHTKILKGSYKEVIVSKKSKPQEG